MNRSNRNKLIEETEQWIVRSHLSGIDHTKELNTLKAKLTSVGLDFTEILSRALQKLDTFELMFESSRIFETSLTERLLDSNQLIHYKSELPATHEQLISFEGELRPFKITGDSMTDFGIAEGDVLLVEPGKFAEGDVAVVRVYDGFFVKKIHIGNGFYELISGNSNFPPVKIPKGMDFEILGRVVYLLRQM